MRRSTQLILLGSLALTSACAGTPETPAAVQASVLPAALESRVYTDLDGAEHALLAADSAGTVLVFWQPWCGSCLAEAPVLASAARANVDWRFFGVVSGADGDVRDYEVSRVALEHGISYPTLRDRDLSLCEGFDVRSTPTLIVLSPDGRVLHRGEHLPAGGL
jgi:thiol-disulfide isomerase/thioredoxin